MSKKENMVEITTIEQKSVFEVLNAINVNGHTEKKNGLTYLSWAWAWAEIKKNFPAAYYTIYENANGLNYHHDGKTAWVKTGVTIEDIEHIEYLPVMDYRNASIALDKLTSFDVNKAIQRSLTKACARHGLGLYIYAGEDLPETEVEAKERPQVSSPQPKQYTQDDIDAAVTAIETCDNMNAYMEIWNSWKNIVPSDKGSAFWNAAAAKSKELKAKQTA